MNKLRNVLGERPWLLVVFGTALFVAADVVMLVIATSNMPEVVR